MNAAVCLVCHKECDRDCDVCLNAICQKCDNEITDELNQETTRMQTGCKWCCGTDVIDDFCDWCKEKVNKRFHHHLKLGPIILAKKYKTNEPITKQMVWNF